MTIRRRQLEAMRALGFFTLIGCRGFDPPWRIPVARWRADRAGAVVVPPSPYRVLRLHLAGSRGRPTVEALARDGDSGLDGLLTVAAANRARAWAFAGASDFAELYLPDSPAEGLPSSPMATLQVVDDVDLARAVIAHIRDAFCDRYAAADIVRSEAEAQLIRALSVYLARGGDGRADADRDPGALVAKLTVFIDTNLDRTLRVPDLAEQAGMSPARVNRAFVQAAGVTPHRYIMERRLYRAVDLVRTTTLGLAEIAATCGFASQAHMTACFSRNLAITPGRVRWRAAVAAAGRQSEPMDGPIPALSRAAG